MMECVHYQVLLLLPICCGFFFIPMERFNLNLSGAGTPATTTITADEITSTMHTSETWSTVESVVDDEEDGEGTATTSEVDVVQTRPFSEIKETLIYLFHLPMYKYLVCAMTALYFVVTGVQYWVPRYKNITTKDSLVHEYTYCANTVRD